MSKFKLSPRARRNIDSIRRYTVKRWGAEQARRYDAQLRDQMRLLTNMPTLGKHRPEVAEGVYCFPHISHVIYYKITNEGIGVAAILHKRMVPERHLGLRPSSQHFNIPLVS